MSTVKISQLPLLTSLNANTSNSLFMGVDIPTGTTGKFTAKTLAKGLYSNEILNVGVNPVVYEGVIGQFSGNSSTYLQVNLQNFDNTGSSDYVASTSDSDNTNNYVDMGINGSNFNDPVYSSMKPYDSYVYSHGPAHYSNQGNLIVGTASSGANILFIAGGTRANNIVAKIGANGITLNTQSYFTFADGSVQSVAGAPANYTQSAFDTANSALSSLSINSGINNTQNTRIQSIETINTVQNTAITVIQGVNDTQNTNITFVDSKAQAAFDAANTVSARQDRTAIINAEQNNRLQSAESNITTLYSYTTQSGVINAGQNTSINLAWSTANSALQNTTVTLNGDLTTLGNVTTNFIRATYRNTNDNSPLVQLTQTASGSVISPHLSGFSIHTTGREGLSSRIVLDSLGSNVLPNFLTRHARGVANTPTPTQTNDTIGRFSSVGYGNTQFNGTSDGRIDISALENFTDTAHGTSISLFATPIGTNAATRVANFSSGNVSLISANTYVSGNTTITGLVDIIKPNLDPNVPFVQITSSDDGSYVAPSNSYYMLQITGKANNATRFVLDSFGVNTYPLVSGRMGRGSASSPAAVANNDVLMRIVGNGYTGTQFSASSPSKIDFVATENFTDSTKGTAIQFWNTPNGSNTIQKIASFNANEVSFSGYVIPQKGFVFTPRIIDGPQTAITVDFASDSLIKATTVAGITIGFTNYVAGKVVEMWITNTDNQNRTITHGCYANNSTLGTTSFTLNAGRTGYLRYFSIDGDLANTFVTITA